MPKALRAYFASALLFALALEVHAQKNAMGPPRARWFEKRTRSRSDISHLVAAITQPEKRRSPMKKGIGIVVAIAAICGLTWGFLELREEGYFSSYAAQPETPAPPQAAGASFTYDFDNDAVGAMP